VAIPNPMFQTTRRRLALWYTTVTAVLLLVFATGFYFYVRNTLVARVDDTLNHVVEVVQRSLITEPSKSGLQVNVEASFRNSPVVLEDDHIDLEWFDARGQRRWSTLSESLPIGPLHPNLFGETVEIPRPGLEPLRLRQITQAIGPKNHLMGYLRVSEPWFEVTKPTRELFVDLLLGTSVMVSIVAAIGWFLSGLAMTPILDSYQRLKQFTADASHELRNPIAVMQTNVQVALADPDPDPIAQQQSLQVIERLTRRLGRLVEDLLFLARQDSGIVQSRTTLVGLGDLLSDLIAEQEPIAIEKGIKLSLVPGAAGEERVMADRDQLFRLFTNLVANALQYTPTGGQVQVERCVQPTGMQVTVRDTGIGIPEAAIPQLFERFYRVDPARAKAGGGSGLGLAIVRAIVEGHQGTIQIESQLGMGTTVTVVLPRGDA
jgi:two-component system, OmpR family, manganese sensing sensor histidine kinase